MKESAYLFYKLQGYPVPKQQEYFVYGESISSELPLVDGTFSRDERDELFQEYQLYIEKYAWLWGSLPFVESIYLCNSITFNALHKDSDIDLFFVVKDGRMRLARWWSVLLFFMCGIKRFGPWVRKKFCLSFYVSEQYLNLHTIKLSPTDPYLVYWLAHLVPLYLEHGQDSPNIYEQNGRLSSYLPNHPGSQTIYLDIETSTGSSRFKKNIEYIFHGRFGDIVESLIKYLRLPILFWKKHRLGVVGKTIILSDIMLKFYADQRQIVATKWKVARK